MERLSGGARTRRTGDLESSDESIDDDEKLGDCCHCGDSGMYGTECDNDDCEDMGTFYM